MSTIATIMENLGTLATGFKHTFDEEVGEEAVFKTVKIYVEENFNKAAKDLLMIDKPALVIVYGGSVYSRVGKASAVGVNCKAVDQRVADFVFFVADQEIGFEGKDEAAFGGGSQAKGAAVLLDLLRDYLALVNPVEDWELPIAPFVPIRDEPFPVDPELGDVAVYTLTMQTRFEETANVDPFTPET